MIEHFLSPEDKSGEKLNPAVRELQMEVAAIMKLLEKYTLVEKTKGLTVQTTTQAPTMYHEVRDYNGVQPFTVVRRSGNMVWIKSLIGAGNDMMSIEDYKVKHPKEAAEYLNSITEDHEEADQTEAEVHEEE